MKCWWYCSEDFTWMKKCGRFILVPEGADILTHLSLIYSVLDSPKKVMHFA